MKKERQAQLLVNPPYERIVVYRFEVLGQGFQIVDWGPERVEIEAENSNFYADVVLVDGRWTLDTTGWPKARKCDAEGIEAYLNEHGLPNGGVR